MAITMWLHYADHALAPRCRSRRGSYMPIADMRYARSEKALVAALAEMYVHGVSR
jgi:transposase-like protein